jgi:hypothetical protein
MPSSTHIKSKKKTWTELVDEPVYTNDDINIGNIDAVNRDFIVVKRGLINMHYYFIPITKVEGWDGNVLWLKISEAEVVIKYQRDETIPHPSRYYIKGYSGYTTTCYPRLKIIRPRYTRPSYAEIINTQKVFIFDDLYKCDLCGELNIKSEDDLSDHVRISH